MALRLLRLNTGARMVARTGFARITTSSISHADARATPALDSIPTDAEQSTGLEKREYEALSSGVSDPFNMSLQKGPAGTKDKPTIVPSMFEQRIVGCICEEDATSINWMVLKQGSSQRCECGNFYQLIHGKTHHLQGEDAH